ncbi:MAG: acetolactate synthase small subunit [Sulfuricaulis sp.]|uniref:acetolactate synthase small subunit n=1 Tax=Sulfuricaulis sp. TaxID=2003553 RepID=UPI0025F12E1B|nr:acetolactate synthase small subunit [Sulfuricaulis sp.]MCR4347500.1 acetolactate synthase small subunit [Sulfuricaulis sp.]
MRHTISMLLENESGALSRVAGLFSARGYNIESLTVAPTEDATLSRLTLVTSGSEDVIEQITKQLNKLVDVVRLVDLTKGQHIEREMLLIKVNASGAARAKVGQLIKDYQGRIIDESDATYTIELTDTSEKLDAFVKAVNHNGIIEVVRSGVSGIARGEKSLRV